MKRVSAWRPATVGLLALALTATIAACSGVETEPVYPERRNDKVVPKPEGERDTIFGPGGFTFFTLGDTGREKEAATDGTGGIAVNSFLWRASLDTMSFMPLASADPFGGVIITDWYSPPESPDERFKVTTYILGRQLRSDGVRVAVFRQKLADGRGWVDTAVEDETGAKLEGAILSRARELRIASAN